MDTQVINQTVHCPHPQYDPGTFPYVQEYPQYHKAYCVTTPHSEFNAALIWQLHFFVERITLICHEAFSHKAFNPH